MKAMILLLLLLSFIDGKLLRDYYEEVKANAHGWEVADPDEVPYGNLTLEELAKIFPMTTPPILSRTYDNDPELEVKSTDDSLPSKFDAREKWEGCIHPVRNQGPCGSCYAHGSTEVLSDRFCIYSNGTINVTLSPQDAVSCGGLICNGCMGCVYPYLWSYLEIYGAVTDKCFPYKKKVDTCIISKGICENPHEEYKKYYAKLGETKYPYFDIDAVKREILKNGPVAAIIFIYIEYLYYKGGVFTLDNGILLSTHFIKVIGWGTQLVDNKLVDYWLIQDSQGVNFGEQGYAKIKMGILGIDSHMSWPVPKLN